MRGSRQLETTILWSGPAPPRSVSKQNIFIRAFACFNNPKKAILFPKRSSLCVRPSNRTLHRPNRLRSLEPLPALDPVLAAPLLSCQVVAKLRRATCDSAPNVAREGNRRLTSVAWCSPRLLAQGGHPAVCREDPFRFVLPLPGAAACPMYSG